jgi:hypothetical protein
MEEASSSWFLTSGSLFLPPAFSTLKVETEFVFETLMNF